MKLNEKGQCPECQKKPLVYKRQPFRGYFCDRCDRSFNLDTGEWEKNWAWQAPYTKTVHPKVHVAEHPPETTESFL